MAPNISTSNAQKSSRKPVDPSTKNNNDLEKDEDEEADLSNYYAEDDPDYLDYDDTYFPGYEEYFQEGYEE